MTFKQALEKKFGPKSLLGKLIGPNVFSRAWHIFELYARNYEKSLSPADRAAFRRVFGG